MFNWLGEHEHRVFNYRPRYFDPREEERKRRFGAVDGSDQKARESGEYHPGDGIRGSLRGGNYSKTRSHSTPAQNIIGLVGLVLVITVLIYMAKFYIML